MIKHIYMYFAVAVLLMGGLPGVSVAAVEVTDTCDVGPGSNDIDTLSASFDEDTNEITVAMTLCDTVDNKTKYQVRFDHTAPFFDAPNDICAKTDDDRMEHRGNKDTGPGIRSGASTIVISDTTNSNDTLTYTVPVAVLNPALTASDTVYVWARTQLKRANDRAPNTNSGDGCDKPEVASEVLALPLTTPSDAFLPEDLGMVFARDFGAVPNDGLDDTDAINAALQNIMSEGFWSRDKTVFLQDGTYLVSGRIEWRDPSGIWRGFIKLRGQSKEGTIIRLMDSAIGYQNPANPKAVIFTASEESGFPSGINEGGGNRGHDVDITNLTVNTGNGNCGAIGIDYIAHNRAHLRNVRIESGDGCGVVGLNLFRNWHGPSLIKDVEIDGFDVAVNTTGSLYSFTIENMMIANQNVVGILNNGWFAAIGLHSNNAVPAIESIGAQRHLELFESTLSGGISGVTAIVSGSTEGTQGAHYYLRDVTTSGYDSALSVNGAIVAGNNIGEISSIGATGGLRLPHLPTPNFHSDDPNDWANVVDFGAIPAENNNSSSFGVDQTPFIQAAIDSGKPIVYLPFGAYTINTPIIIRGSVRKIIGLGRFYPGSSTSFPDGTPAIVMESTGSPVIIEGNTSSTNFWAGPSFGFGKPYILHVGTADLVLKHTGKGAYENEPGSGDVYFEDALSDQIELNGNNAYARHLNMENIIGPRILNNGGKAWIFGLKTESQAVAVETISGGETEMLGAYLHMGGGTNPPSTQFPMFINRDSKMSISMATNNFGTYATIVREDRAGVITDILFDQVPRRFKGTNAPLIVSDTTQ